MGAPALTKRQKAAIIVRFLLSEGADVPLMDLPEELQERLTTQMGDMRYVDRDTLGAVLSEFAEELERLGMTFPKGLAAALKELDGRLSPQTAARLRKEAGVRQSGDPWEQVRDADPELLLSILKQESLQVGAVMLSKLEVTKSAELLCQLPGPQARKITYAVRLTEQVSPDAVYRIGLSLATQIADQPPIAFEDSPVKRVGALLNYAQAATRDDVLEGLEAEDEDFAAKVRKAIFTFNDIPDRVDPKDVPAIVREVDQNDFVTALAYAFNDETLLPSAEYMLENMSKRMAEGLREEAREMGRVKQKLGEEAMTEVVNAIRRLEADGQITFMDPDEEEEG